MQPGRVWNAIRVGNVWMGMKIEHDYVEHLSRRRAGLEIF